MFMILPKEIMPAALNQERLLPTFPPIGYARFAALAKISFLRRSRKDVLPREDFIFTIGFDGPIAVVDKVSKNKYGKLTTRQLAEKGLFRAAFSSAVFSDDPEEKKLVVDIYLENYEKATGGHRESLFLTPERLFGVSLVDVNRSLLL
jgi:hypothetical protein